VVSLSSVPSLSTAVLKAVISLSNLSGLIVSIRSPIYNLIKIVYPICT
jgi:hypothetical protein